MQQMFQRLRRVWTAGINREQYFIAGLVLSSAKYLFDRIAYHAATGRLWYPTDYLKFYLWFDYAPGNQPFPSDFIWLFAATAIPFVVLGSALSLMRLRNAGLPQWLVALLFLMPLNLVLFVVLSLWPSRPTAGSSRLRGSQALNDFFNRAIPKSQIGAAAAAIGLTLLAALMGALFCINVLAIYGTALFVGIPFFIGASSGILYSYHRRRTRTECYSVAFQALFIFAGILIILAIEGLICLLMAAPLAIIILVIGAEVAYAVQPRQVEPPQQGNRAAALVVFGLLGVPLMGTGEWLVQRQVNQTATDTVYDVTTVRDVAAPPEAVWDALVEFSTIPEPTEWYFRAGIAYPIRADIKGRGVGAVRYCRFQTGAFVEPITVWEPGKHLAFTVAAQPTPMIELTPYRDLKTPHLDGFFQSQRGEFRLERLPNGHTRLSGTTWYINRLQPVGYWNLFTKPILHAIHGRVLDHIARQVSPAVAQNSPQ